MSGVSVVTGCLVCGKDLPASTRGRPPRYCSRACRSKAYRERVAEHAQPPVSLTTQGIVRAAIDLADEQGAAALTMRGVATRLAAGPMSLYRYVSGREELVDLIADTLFADSPLPEDSGPEGWRARLELSARQEWALYRAHPWLAGVAGLVSRPAASPNVMAYTDWRMRAVDGHGLPLPTLVQIAVLVSQFVRSSALSQAWPPGGLTHTEWLAARHEAYQQSVTARDLPMIARFGADELRATEPESTFEFGLARVLDGIATLIDE